MNDRIADISARLQRQSDAEKEASGSLNPTRFEGDLASALRGEDRLSAYQSARGKSVALKCAKALQGQTGRITGATQTPKSSGNGASVLTPVYKHFMCGDGGKCSGDPKSDLIVKSQMNGEMHISMKKMGSAQIATALAGESNAVISAALGRDKEIPTLVRSILSQTLSKEYYYSTREKYANATGGNPEDFDSMLANLTGLKTRGETPSSADLKAFNRFLQMMGIKEKITHSLRDYMASSSVRKKIFREFASGEKRYIAKESYRSADWFLQWNDEGAADLSEIDGFIDNHLGSFRMNIRDRGNESGGALRIDIRDSSDFKETEKMLHEDFDKYCLTEGVADTTLNIIRTAGSAVAKLYKNFVAAIKSFLTVVAALFAEGTAALLEYFGIETTEMSYSW